MGDWREPRRDSLGLRVGVFCLEKEYWRGNGEATPDKEALQRLMIAILRDALCCLRNGLLDRAKASARKEALAAARWIGDEDEEPLFSFCNVCETLGINPEALRESLKRSSYSGRNLGRRSPVVHTRIRAAMSGGPRLRGKSKQNGRSLVPGATECLSRCDLGL